MTAEVLAVGTRIRSRLAPDLTGYIKGHEWNRPGVLSAIPYLISWDDSGLARKLLGWLFVYAGPDSVERIRDH